MRWRLSACIVGMVAAAQPMLAQQGADSIAFRSGQWAAEFGLGSEAAGINALRFLAPHRALVLGGGAGWSRAEPRAGFEDTMWELEARLGLRWFRLAAPRVRQYVTVGARGGTNGRRDSSPAIGSLPAQETESSGAFGGLFVNVGGMWLASPNIGMGGNWEATYTRLTYSDDGGGFSDARSQALSFGRARLLVTFIF